jgi:hypothetical protein
MKVYSNYRNKIKYTEIKYLATSKCGENARNVSYPWHLVDESTKLAVDIGKLASFRNVMGPGAGNIITLVCHEQFQWNRD